jgi:membrane protein YqaA with SNARE-associated domain
MIRKLYDYTMSLAAKPQAKGFLATVSFIESSIFPIPPDVMLIPMVLANRKEAWRIAAICSIFSVLGGLLGYFIGIYFFQLIGMKTNSCAFPKAILNGAAGSSAFLA